MSIEKVVNIKVNASQATESIKGLNKEISNTEKETKKASEATNDATSQIDKMTGGAITQFKSVVGVLKTVALGFKGIGSAIALSGLGLLIITIAAITAAFKGSEEGQNKFAKLTAVIGTVVGNLVDVLATLGEKLIYVFENPKKSLIAFGDLIKQNIVNRFNGMLELLPAIGKAIKLVFEGEFAKAGEVAFNAVSKVSTGIEDTTGKLKGLVAGTKEYLDEQKREIQQTKDVADMRAKAVKIDRALLVERAKMEEKIADLKLKSRDIDNNSAEERAKALKEAQVLEDSLLAKEQISAKLKFDAQKLENTFSRTNIENADKEAQAEANLYNIGTRRKEQQKATLRELNRVNSEIRGNEKALNAERQKEIEALAAAKKKLNDEEVAAEKLRLEKIRDLEKKYKDSIADILAVSAQQKLDLQKSREQAEIDSLKGTLDEKLLIQTEHNEKFDLLQKEVDEKNKEEAKKKDEEYWASEAEKAEKAEELEKERRAKVLESTRNFLTDINSLTQEGSNEQIAIQEAQLQLEKIMADGKIDLQEAVSAGLNIAAKAAGESTAAGKALAVTATTIDTLQSGISAFKGMVSSIPGPVGIAAGAVAAAGVVASGFASVKKILSVKVPGASGGAGGSTPSAPAPAPAPSFNLVQGTGSNQIAESLATERQPIQAFVVSGNVTSQQELDRNSRSEGTV